MESRNLFSYFLFLLLYVLVWSIPAEIGRHPEESEQKDSAFISPVVGEKHTTTGDTGRRVVPLPSTHRVPQGSKGLAFRKEWRKILGVKENPPGSNSGPEVNMFLAYCGLEPRTQWCAATFCERAGRAGIPNPKSGYTPTLVPKERVIYKAGDSWFWFVKNYGDRLDTMVLAASIYVPEKRRDGHLFAVNIMKGEYLYTYEGNYKDMALANKRHWTTINKIADWTPN